MQNQSARAGSAGPDGVLLTDQHLLGRCHRPAGLDVKAKRARYVGRAAAAATATGLYSRFLAEQKKLVDEALTL